MKVMIAYAIFGCSLAMIAGATATIGPTPPDESPRSVDLTSSRETTGWVVAVAAACAVGAVALHVIGPLPTTAIPVASRKGEQVSLVEPRGPRRGGSGEPISASGRTR